MAECLFRRVFSLGDRNLFPVVLLVIILLGLFGCGGYLYGRGSQKTSGLPTPSPAITTFPITRPSGEGETDWPVYENEEYNLSFRYPPWLVIETLYPSEALLRVDFIGEECAQIPVLERGHTPSLSFTVTRATDPIKEMIADVCAQELGPNCRGQTIIEPVPLDNGMAARLIKIFGVSGDGTSLVITKSGLDFIFGSGSGPVPCGQRNHYTQEIFQMAGALTFGT